MQLVLIPDEHADRALVDGRNKCANDQHIAQCERHVRREAGKWNMYNLLIGKCGQSCAGVQSYVKIKLLGNELDRRRDIG